MNYQLFNNELGELAQIIKTEESGKRWYIPLDPANTSYKEYLEWLAAGNTPEPADPEPADS